MARRPRSGPTFRPDRVQLGPYWLEYRDERDDWCICWYDTGARTRRRRSTGIGGGSKTQVPDEAREALAEFYLERAKPEEPQAPSTVAVAELLTIWQREHVATKADPSRYAVSVDHWLTFFERERRTGRVTSGVLVSDINKDFINRFITWRFDAGVGGHTVSRDLAALRGAINYAWRDERITSKPFIREVDAKDKARPRELTYTMEQMAGLLEAAYSRPDRRHVFLYTLIAMSTAGRSEAILELQHTQIKDGLIYFLASGRAQTSKRRSIVPVAPTLAPWLEGIKGKVIRYRAEIARKKWSNPKVPEYFERDCYDLGNAFDACLVEAGICNQVLDQDGNPVMLPPRKKLRETEPRPLLKGIGTPNTLRHTIMTVLHARGVPEAQIDAAAGHLGEGTNKRNYRHLRPDYLAEMIEAIEAYWRELSRFTTVHLRSQHGPKVANLAQARAGRRIAKR